MLELVGFVVELLVLGFEVLVLVGLGFVGVIVSDICMFGMDGMMLLGWLCDIDFDLLVIFVIGYVEVFLVVEVIWGGVYDFIEKLFCV